MGRPAAVVRMTYAEYLAAEAASAVRHEYLAGDVWAMAARSSTAVSPSRW